MTHMLKTYKNDIALSKAMSVHVKGICMLTLSICLCAFLTVFPIQAQAQIYSKAAVKVSGLKDGTQAYIDIQNSGTRHESTVNKNGEVYIEGLFPEDLKRGVSSGVNYTLVYEMPYKNLSGVHKNLRNELTFSFSAFTGDLLFMGRTSDTALIEFTTGTNEMQSMTASTSGIFRGAGLRNPNYKTNNQGSAFIIITNTNPVTGDPLPPVYIEAGFNIAKPPSTLVSREGVKAIYDSITQGLFTFQNANVGAAWGQGLRMMAMEFSTNMMAQVAAVGGLLDGYMLNKTVRRMQILSAETAQRHMPSVNMCQFPTLGKSLARTSFGARANTQVFAKIMQDYDLQHVDSAGSMLSNHQMRDYITKFREHYCHEDQNGPDGLERFCTGGGVAKDRVNNDVNFPYFFSTRMGNNVDFLDADDPVDNQNSAGDGVQELTNGEIDLMRLTANLYDSNIHKFKQSLYTSEDAPRALMNIRSLQAIRNVAKNSFAVLVGNRSGSSSFATKNQYVQNVLLSMGVANNADALTYYGIDNNNGFSYDGIMEVLTKKIYQDPAFYINLYDNPENVMRQKASIKAIQLMQGWDIVKALHRREMLLAMILELKLRKQQRFVEINTK